MNPTQEQLTAYFSGQASADVKQLVETWLAQLPNEQQVEDSIRTVMDAMPDIPIDYNNIPAATLQAHERFRELVKANEPGKQQHVAKTIPMFQPLLRFVIGAAAVGLLFVLGMALFKYYFAASRNPPLATVPHDTVFYATRAAITKIRLADSSTVRLFPGSSLTVNNAFNIKDRRVALQGRGFFEVAHNTAKPFYVRAGSVTTKVLGTAFEVSTMDTAMASVILQEGKVNVSKDSTLLSVLLPNQGIRVNNATGVYTVQIVDAASLCSWTKGTLDFRQVPLRNILHTLEWWYGVSFNVQSPSLLNRKFTFFVRGQQLQQSMDILAAAGHFHYRISNGNVSIQ